MKTQLLQDIDESHPSSTPWPAPPEAPPVASPPARTRSFAEQWRQAGLSPSSPVPVFDARPAQAAAAAQQAAPPTAPEPAPAPDDGQADFMFEGIERLAAQLDNEPGWFDRWGRKAANWSLGLAGAVLLAGAGLWVYQDSQLERTLAAVAKGSPQLAETKSAPAVPAPPPEPAAPPTAPPLVMLNEAPVEPAREAVPPPEGVAVVKQALASPQDVAEVDVKGKVAKVPAEDSAAPARGQDRAPAPRASREKAVARAEPPPAPQASERASQLALTLKQCRIEGYHAEQCIKRGCVLTKYGLACKGSRLGREGPYFSGGK